VCNNKYRLEDKLDSKLSNFCTKLTMAYCSWPVTMASSTCMEEALSTDCNTQGNANRSSGVASTDTNILQAFENKLYKMRLKTRVGGSNMLGGTATINLPVRVELDILLCKPNLDRPVGSVNLYVVLKKDK
jgi:hypothetical protein